MSELSRQAEAAIGQDDAGADWKLNPKSHASDLPLEAGALRRVLERPEIQSIISEFEVADKEAVEAQRRYKRVARLRLYTGVAATIVGATFILPVDEWMKGFLSIPTAVQYGCLVVSIVAALHLIRSKPFDVWMKARAKAEIARIALFDEVMKAVDGPAQPRELPLLPLQFEYFRRYQLEVQLRFYEGRGKQHDRAAGHTERWKYVSIGLTAIAGAIAAISVTKLLIDLAPVPDWIKADNETLRSFLPSWTNKAVLAIGIVSSTLFGASISRSLMDLDERNASRYLTTWENLKFIKQTLLETARADAVAGRAEEVKKFVKDVQDKISSEHREWIVHRDASSDNVKKGTSVQMR